MTSKVIVFAAQLCLIQNILGQCIGNIGSSYNIGNCEGLGGIGYEFPNSWGCSNVQWPGAQLNIADFSIVGASNGGSLNVQTSSSISPGSISIVSENQIQGPLSVHGTLPFLSAVALEGSLPTQGSGAVAYQCGDGRVAILEENNPASDWDYIDSDVFGENSNCIGLGWNLAGPNINAANIYGRNYGYGWNGKNGCSCFY